MRRLKGALLPLVTLLLMAAGAAMPWAVFRLQDAYGENRQEERQLDLFSLTLREEADLSRTLGLIQEGNYYTTDQAPDAALTGEEAVDAVREALKLMSDLDLVEPWVPENMSGFRALPAALVSYGEDVSAAMWTVSSDNIVDGYNYMFWVDDASGKLFLACLPAASLPESKNLDVVEERWRQFVEVYYGVDIFAVSEEWHDSCVEFLLQFRLGEEEPFRMRLLLSFLDNFVTLTPY